MHTPEKPFAERLLGGRHRNDFIRIVNRLFLVGGILALATSLCYYTLGAHLLTLLTDAVAVIATAKNYLPLVALIPIVSYPAFLFDGIFIGMTNTLGMLRALVIATLVFAIVYFTLYPYCGNTSLWLAFLSYLGVRGIVQGCELFYRG